jgi:dCTP diphosphatase
MDISELKDRLAKFARNRNWEGFHTPKNLAMAITVEAAELAEIFQWMTPEESLSIANDKKAFKATQEELADILIYSIRLAGVLNIDVEKAIDEKMEINSQKYPAGRK